MNFYVTYKYYDKDKRRLAVFARFFSPTEVEIFTLACSRQEQFSKKYAKKVYENYLDGNDLNFELHKPTIELVQVAPEQGELKTLINYCREKYHILVDVYVLAKMFTTYNELKQLRDGAI